MPTIGFTTTSAFTLTAGVMTCTIDYQHAGQRLGRMALLVGIHFVGFVVLSGDDNHGITFILNTETPLPSGVALGHVFASGSSGNITDSFNAGWPSVGGNSFKLLAAMGMHGGSPVLYLACAIPGPNLTSYPSYGLPYHFENGCPRGQGLNIAVSTDFGETFRPGQQVGGTSYALQLYTAHHVSGEPPWIPSGSGYGLGSDTVAYGHNHLPVSTFLCLPNGRLYINSIPYLNGYIFDWVDGVYGGMIYLSHARICDDMLATSSKWRDATQSNEALYQEWHNAVPMNVIWASSGAYTGTLGGGGKAKTPFRLFSKTYPYVWTNYNVSTDAGDTWQAGETQPSGTEGNAPLGPVISQRGFSFDGARYSQDDFHNTVMPVGADWLGRLLCSVDGEACYTIDITHEFEALPPLPPIFVTLPYLTVRRGPAFTITRSTQIFISQTKDGGSLIPMYLGSSLTVQGWSFQGKIILAYTRSQVEYGATKLSKGNLSIIQIAVTENEGAWWKLSCHSIDNGLTWVND